MVTIAKSSTVVAASGPVADVYAPSVSALFAGSAIDYISLRTTTAMPSGGSISRSGQGMLYDSTGKLTYAPNNLVQRSQEFDNAYWSKVGSTITANSTAAPDATTTADTLIEDTGTSQHNAQIALTPPSKSIFSIYAKQGSGTRLLRLINYNATDGVQGETYFNLTTGTVSSGSGSISSIGNGWYRCSISSSNTVSTTIFISVAQSVGTYSYTGDGSSSIYIWGAQLEAVTYQTSPSTYVATTTAAYYGPRFDYNPSTLAAKGLLIEGTRTNLVLNSNFQGTWTARNSAVLTANNTTSPDGTSNAAKIDLAAGTTSDVYQTITTTVGDTLTYSVWLKGSVGGEIVRLQYYNATDGAVYKAVTLTTSWQRYTYTAKPSASGTWYVASNGAAVTVYAYGAQLEVGLFASSLVPTTSSSASRAAETFAITGYSSNLINAYYTDEATNTAYSQPYNAGTAPSPSFSWLTSLRPYTNAYAGSISSPSWLSFSRSGNALMTDSTGELTYAPTNILTYSQDFSNAAWTKTNGSITATNITDPNGGSTASQFTVSATGSVSIYPGISLSDGVTYVTSIYLKMNTQRYVQIYSRSFGFGATVYANYDLQNGTVTANSAGLSAFCINVGNGWYRCGWAAISGSASSNGGMIVGVIDTSTSTRASGYTGATGVSFYLWGSQTEPVTYETQPSAYIPTTTAAVYGPRYDFDPSTVPATPRGLLIEESRSNLFTYSEQFDNAAWSKLNTTITANNTVAPDGTSNADKLIATTTNGQHYIQQTITVTGNTSYTLSAYFKAAEYGYCGISTYDGTAGRENYFNILNGTVTASTLATGSVVNVGNGWYRCITTITTASAATSLQVYLRVSNVSGTSGYSYAGDGTSGIFIWGAQLEAGSFATSYIPTTTASVTRAADVAQWTSAAFTSYWNASAGSLAVETTIEGGNASSFPRIVTFTGSNANTDDIGIYWVANNNTLGGVIRSGGTNFAVITAGSNLIAGNTARGAFGWSTANANFASNTSLGTLDTSLTLPTIIQFGFGLAVASQPQYNGWIRSFAYYNTRLPDAVLKTKSAVGAPY